MAIGVEDNQGVYLKGQNIAKTAIKFNSFVKRDPANPRLWEACAEGDEPDGLVETNDIPIFEDGTERTGWKAGESLNVKIAGPGYVIVSEDVDPGDKLTTDADGEGKVYTLPTIGDSFSKTELEAVRDIVVDYKAKVLESALATEAAYVVLKNIG